MALEGSKAEDYRADRLLLLYNQRAGGRVGGCLSRIHSNRHEEVGQLLKSRA